MDQQTRDRVHRIVQKSLERVIEMVQRDEITVKEAADKLAWDLVDAYRMLVCTHCGRSFIADKDLLS